MQMKDDDEDDEDDYGEDEGNSSMYSNVASQHPLSVNEEGGDDAVDGGGVGGPGGLYSQRSNESLEDPTQILNKLKMTKREIMPFCLYTFLYFFAITIPTMLLYNDCKSSPHYISHVIFLVLQVFLLALSTYYYRKRANS
jgi:hypothetical protein